MNITSLLITLAGIIFIFALYLMSRIAQSKLPKKQKPNIPDLKDNDGKPFSSILDDIPARDGSTPKSTDNPQQQADQTGASDVVSDNGTTDDESCQAQKNNNESDNVAGDKQINKTLQHILFISAREGSQLDGNKVEKALLASGLTLGDKDIYHYNMIANSQAISLFRVANGMEPWTLTHQDLDNKKLAGLSVVMTTPTKINDIKAMKTFINITKKIANSTDGIIKNQQQQLFTAENEQAMIKLMAQK